jgi:hypothetical protein
LRVVPLRHWVLFALAVGCSGPVAPLQTAEPGVLFTYPANGQLDVPTGARIVVSFSDPVDKGAVGSCTATSGGFCVVGPDGPVDVTPVVSEDGKTVSMPASELAEGTTYQVIVRSELAPEARNLPGSGPLVTFTTRSTRPRAAAPELVAFNGAAPGMPDAFRPLFETSTLRLVFSEPLDPRTVTLAAGSIELLDATGSAVPATLVSNGIHVAIDPKDDLTPGAMYVLRLGSQLLDLGGQAIAPTTLTITPHLSEGAPIPQKLRTRQEGDPGPEHSRSGATPNEIVIDKPLIGRETSQMLPSVLAAELGDPKAIGGPIAFTIRKGQRLRSTGMDIALGGEIATGLSTGEVWIELLTDGGGRIYRNPHQAAEQRPENDRAPLYVDLSMDVAVYAVDANGNAALTQTVLGLQGVGTAIATDGVLAIETVASMDLALLGVTKAPTNLVLELISDEDASLSTDTVSPSIVATYPEQSSQHAVDEGIDVVFSEPIDLDRARAGGVRLEDTNGVAVPSVIESQGAAVVVRPLAPLAYSKIYRVVFGDVADAVGNKAAIPNLSFVTPALIAYDVPLMATAVYPGTPCALTGATATSPGRCDGGLATDELYRPFALPANDPIEVTFSQPLRRSSVTRGTVCGQGSVRIEDTSGGTCTVVPGTLLVRARSLSFIPDVPWSEGRTYRLTLVSGSDETCSAGELCGPTSAANFDPLKGSENGDGGGPPLVITFLGAPRGTSTYMLTNATPLTDINGSGFQEAGEQERDENHAALRITGTTDDVSSAVFEGTDCIPSTPEKESCMYIQGAMPVRMGELSTSCGSTGATSCIPVTESPQAMLSTNTTMTANTGIDITTDTGASVMRVREPAGGDVMGYIVDRGGTPTFITTLELYMDAPDMSIPLSSHDLHSKPLSITLEGPVAVLPDGRIAIQLANTADVPVVVAIDAPLGIAGTVKMIVPKGEMKLQLMSPAPRGRAP